jgi:hypothetical protein
MGGRQGGVINSDLVTDVTQRCRLAAAGALGLFDGFVGLEAPSLRLTAPVRVN